MGMDEKFREIEEKFNQLKRKFRQKKISEREYKDQLKELRLKDGNGRFWTLGARTGEWYCFNGKEWINAHPPSIQERKAICIYCGAENDLDTEVCIQCGGNVHGEDGKCPSCGRKLEGLLLECPVCDRGGDTSEGETISLEDEEAGSRSFAAESGEDSTPLVFRSISPMSFFFFFGTVGLFMGIVFGAFVGASAFFSGTASLLPKFLLDLQGKLLGAIIYGLLGGVSGFIVFALAGWLMAQFVNLVLLLVGGIKIKAE